MQRCMEDAFNRLAERFGIRAYVYLDDVLLLGSFRRLVAAVKYLRTTDITINKRKSVLSPRRTLP